MRLDEISKALAQRYADGVTKRELKIPSVLKDPEGNQRAIRKNSNKIVGLGRVMKTMRKTVNETVNEPIDAGERRFVAKHRVQKFKRPADVGPDEPLAELEHGEPLSFARGSDEKWPIADRDGHSKRFADYVNGEDEAVYESVTREDEMEQAVYEMVTSALERVSARHQEALEESLAQSLVEDFSGEDFEDELLAEISNALAKRYALKAFDRQAFNLDARDAAAQEGDGERYKTHDDSIKKRSRGFQALARRKLRSDVKEDTQLDEISGALRRDYMTGARKSLADADRMYGAHEVGAEVTDDHAKRAWHNDHMDKFEKTIRKRQKGLNRAEYYREDTEELGESKQMRQVMKMYGIRPPTDGPAPKKPTYAARARAAAKEEIRRVNGNALDRYKSHVKEDTDLSEGLRLNKVTPVTHDEHSAEFAKHYVAAEKGNFTSNPSQKAIARQAKAQGEFANRYRHVEHKTGFGGTGHDVYHDKLTGAKHKITRRGNGKGFYGNDHHVTKVD